MSHTPKFKVERFDGKGNFNHWQSRVKDLLIQRGLKKALTGEKPQDMSNADWEDLDERAMSTIRLNMANEFLSNILDEKTTKSMWENSRAST